MVNGQVTITPPGGAARRASVEVGEQELTIAPEGEPAITVRLVDVDDLFDDDYTLRLSDYTGRRFDLTMLGKAYGQVLADVRKRRDELLQHDLLLTGVNPQDRFPAKIFGGPAPVPAELRLFEDLLVVVPERGTMWGIPFSFVEEVAWDEELYQVHVRTDDGAEVVFGHLAKRSEEFRDELRRLLAALERRTASTLQALLPALAGDELDRLAHLMRDGRAVRRDAVDPRVWEQLEAAVVGTEELRATYEWLTAHGDAAGAALGVKSVQDGSGAVLWFFCPIGGAVAQEITSEGGHATYFFRLDDGDSWPQVSRLNRALLTLNFRREPIYGDEQEIESGRFQRYRVAVRKLDYLRFARERFLGRAIHDESWESQVEAILDR